MKLSQITLSIIDSFANVEELRSRMLSAMTELYGDAYTREIDIDEVLGLDKVEENITKQLVASIKDDVWNKQLQGK